MHASDSFQRNIKSLVALVQTRECGLALAIITKANLRVGVYYVTKYYWFCQPLWLVCTGGVCRSFLLPLHVWECQAEASYDSATGCASKRSPCVYNVVFGPSKPFCPLKLLKVDTHGDGLQRLGETWNRVQRYWAPVSQQVQGFCRLAELGNRFQGWQKFRTQEETWIVRPMAGWQVTDLTDFHWL